VLPDAKLPSFYFPICICPCDHARTFLCSAVSHHTRNIRWSSFIYFSVRLRIHCIHLYYLAQPLYLHSPYLQSDGFT
jgi:hypothetical protein